MPSKRKRVDNSSDLDKPLEVPARVKGKDTIIDQIRQMEEFAALGQYLFMFGTTALKLRDSNREDLEQAFLDPQSILISQILQSLVKLLDPDARITAPGQLEESARKMYRRWKPESNPFGGEEVAKPFSEMDHFAKIRVLHQLSNWTFIRPHILREKMGDSLPDELSWRMEPCGFDRNGNTYYVLDDNRLYRRGPLSEPESPIPQRRQKAKARRRSAKRRRLSATAETKGDAPPQPENTGQTWECVCVTFQDWLDLIASLKRSKDEDDEALYAHLQDDILPELQKVEARYQKSLLNKAKEEARLAAVANRKRSSRIDARMALKKQEEEKAAEQQRQTEQLRKSLIEEKKRFKEREARMAQRDKQRAREKRLRESEANSGATSGNDSSVSGARSSTRRSSTRARPRESAEEPEWMFDCECGVFGIGLEDGSAILSCDKCEIWQHLACQSTLPTGFTEGPFTCNRCKRLEEAAKAAQALRNKRTPSKSRSPVPVGLLAIATSQNQPNGRKPNGNVTRVATAGDSNQDTVRKASWDSGSVNTNSLNGSKTSSSTSSMGPPSPGKSALSSADFPLGAAEPGNTPATGTQNPATTTTTTIANPQGPTSPFLPVATFGGVSATPPTASNAL